jgi:hypothetical protein
MKDMTEHQYYPQEDGRVEQWGPVGFPSFTDTDSEQRLTLVIATMAIRPVTYGLNHN